MNKIIPILPCPSLKDQISFYEKLGFTLAYISPRPHSYAVLRLGSLELHFYGSKKTVPSENPQMCYVQVDEVDLVYEQFTSSIKMALGKIPRTGVPRISKMKHLKEDRRFMMTDMGETRSSSGRRTRSCTNLPPFSGTLPAMSMPTPSASFTI